MNSSRNIGSKPVEFALRSASPKDTDFAKKAHKAAYFEVVLQQFGGWDEVIQDKFFAAAWNHPGFQIISFQKEDCGYCRIENLKNEIIIHELVIRPEFQGHGVGTSLLAETQAHASKRGVPVRLEVLKANRAAKLYQRMGFRAVGQSETHIQMEWTPLGKSKNKKPSF